MMPTTSYYLIKIAKTMKLQNTVTPYNHHMKCWESQLVKYFPVLFLSHNGNGIGDAVIRLSPNKDPQKLTGSE